MIALHSIATLFLLALLLGFTSAQRFNSYEVHYKWRQMDYNFPNNSVREELIQNGGFVQKNVVPTAIKIFQNKIFVATPRYFTGVPSTLNVIPYRRSHFDQWFNPNPKLTPFPSYEMQEIGDCSKLQLVQSMELDSFNRLWIVDVGRVELLTPAPRNLCPPKLVLVDLMNGNMIDRVYEFPDEVAPKESNFVKDIQIACESKEDCFAYISDLNVSSIVVYDYKNNDSWRATHPTMLPDMEKANITIEGTSALTPFGITGLGLTPKFTNHSTLYFSKIAGVRIYSVSTATLKNPNLKQDPNLQTNDVRDLGQKPTGQADGAAMDNKGRWFFGSLPQCAVYYVDTSGNPTTVPRATKVVGSTRDMQWVDTFSFDGAGYLAFTTNRFQLIDSQAINPNEINYRIIRFRTNSVSYQS